MRSYKRRSCNARRSDDTNTRSGGERRTERAPEEKMSATGAGTKSREVRLAARPVGFPKESDFAFADIMLDEPGEGQVLVRNVYMSVDPYMRGRMNDVKSYVPPF